MTPAQQIALRRLAGESLPGEAATKDVTWESVHRAGWSTGPTAAARLTDAGSRKVQEMWDRQDAWR